MVLCAYLPPKVLGEKCSFPSSSSGEIKVKKTSKSRPQNCHLHVHCTGAGAAVFISMFYNTLFSAEFSFRWQGRISGISWEISQLSVNLYLPLFEYLSGLISKLVFRVAGKEHKHEML